MILADGAREDVMRALLKSGELPHIQKELVDRGSFLKGTTTFPSTTGPAYFPFLTGRSPGSLNVPGIRWFDKEKFQHRSYCGIETFLINKDARPVETIFHRLPKAYNIFNAVCDGAGRRNLTKIVRIWYWYYAHLTDRWDYLDKVGIQKMIRALRYDFEFLFVVLPGIDEYSHLAHPHHDKTIEQYRVLDRGIGALSEALKILGKQDDTLIWIVSDHGLSKTDHHFCINTFLEKRGLDPFYYPKVANRSGKNSANMMSGNGMTHVYIKNGDSWCNKTTRQDIDRISPRLIEDLLSEEAVDIVAIRNSGGGFDIVSRRGESRVAWKNGSVLYTPIEKDPFGFVGIQGEVDAATALQKTIETDYPDAIWQLGSMTRASRAGDIVISATPGHDLRDAYEIPEHKGSHGGLHREHMHVPIITNAQINQTYCRTTDVYPTMMSLLGKSCAENLDGVVLL